MMIYLILCLIYSTDVRLIESRDRRHVLKVEKERGVELKEIVSLLTEEFFYNLFVIKEGSLIQNTLLVLATGLIENYGGVQGWFWYFSKFIYGRYLVNVSYKIIDEAFN